MQDGTNMSTQKKPRARDLGLLFDGVTGQHNAITDVPGVEVGFHTLKRGEGELQIGKGPVLTGVTAILPVARVRKTYRFGPDISI